VRKIRVDRRKVGIDTIKRIGRYTVPIELFTDVDVEVKTLVVPEGGELPPEEELEAMEAAERAEEEEAAEAAAAVHAEAEELVHEVEVEVETDEDEAPAETADAAEAPEASATPEPEPTS
jgi:ribosomal protein L9